MGNNCFLFEFASMEAAEHVLRGSWSWKKQSLQLQWWTPTVGAIQSRAAIKQTWVRRFTPALVVRQGL
uniref:Putative ovule protein n=1 Tax=Solanum chacoense TaxID=4108 RepID=A0A0V0HHM2_SOLCH